VAFRLSEYEPLPLQLLEVLKLRERYWLDGFEADWWLDSAVVDAACRRSALAVVSPEIHGRDPERAWTWFAQKFTEGCDISICTDRPYEVMEILS